jgi:L-lactate dehydrogenase
MTAQAAIGTTKVAVVGAGSVGATCAYACLIRGIGTIALYDINADKTRAEVLDLNHGLQFVPQATVVGSDDIEVCRGADLVVITAGAKQKPGQTRLELAEANVALSRAMIPQLLEVAPDAILLLVTNPVDVITYAALKLSGLPPQRVFGSGTVLDSSRLRLLVADLCGVAVQNVHAYIAGEHGDSEIPLWSSASIGSVPLLAWDFPGRPPLDGQAGIHDVCLSLPSVVDRLGVEMVLPSPLSEEEAEGLRQSADTVKGVIRSLGL